MMYYININQKALNEYEDLDLIDGALLSFMRNWTLSSKSQKLSYNDKLFVWVNPELIIKQMPKLGIKTRQGIFNRFEKLIKNNLIDRHPDNKKMNRTYLALGPEYDNFIHAKGVNENLQGVNDGLHGCQRELTGGVNDGLHDNKNKDNKNKDNKRKEGAREKIIMPFESENFKKFWIDWKEYKKIEHGFKYKSIQSEQAALNKLTKLAGGDESTAREIILQSLESGWKGFFELKNNSNGKSSTNNSNGQLIDKEGLAATKRIREQRREQRAAMQRGEY